MKTKHFWFISLAMGIYIFLAIYFYRLFVGTEFSMKSSTWGEFGSYISGVIGSVIALASFLLLLVNIRLYNDEIMSVKETLKISQMKDKRDELVMYIHMLERDIMFLLDEDISLPSGRGILKLKRVLKEHANVVDLKSIQQYLLYLELAKQVVTLAEELDKISSYKRSEEFYKNKYPGV
ncbi:hypothetical protein G3N56_05530 [Desulfovibrio sulfodismutans]|uniref:DUF4760 domain-containing protein n=1 Tax=Desulfolutivibrio sulfodismutans TaxID=63561 RepID=A0A7K3NJC7_9BACT|nr:hypothetical protein [Desulfolutivibrio sulfodismutans]NDY56207.1 hypothetical protein [Desulfolutivibrio sulfodismutans]QLA12361.1 hypothetical protein GD606_08785 [Desulfolutivibrio sulfodismutans DSM 3696]